MASENVKIRINEYDKTSPAGSPTDSTDIAFVPGFSSLATAPKNDPILCTTVEEFEAAFGKTPLVLSTKDTESYVDYGFKAGDYDRSYVYAKELLYQGMSVVYSNLMSDSNYVTLTNIKPLKTSSYVSINDIKTDCSIDETKGVITLTPKGSYMTDLEITVIKGVHIEAATDGKPATTDVFVNGICSNQTAKITGITFTVTKPSPFHNDVVVNRFADNHYEFVNKGATVVEDIELTLKIKVNLSKFAYDPTSYVNNTFTVELFEKSDASLLDAFYGKDATISEQLDLIADKSVYSVKYITSGGYPSITCTPGDNKKATPHFSAKLLSTAATRGDAVAIIDYQNDETRVTFNTDNTSGAYYANMHSIFANDANGEYGTMMYPWSIYSCSAAIPTNPLIDMPASFGYLMCVAKAIKSSPNWLAMAGVTRGIVPGIQKLLTPRNVVTNTVAEEMQPKYGKENHRLSINCITNVRPYGLTLWGNRTLKHVSNDGTVALNFLNIRNMLSDIKKLLYTSAKSVMFEQDSDTTWRKFKGGIEPLLRQLKTGNGISDYQIVRSKTRYNGDPLTKGEIAAVIKIYPLFALEYFELSVEINDQEVTVI